MVVIKRVDCISHITNTFQLELQNIIANFKWPVSIIKMFLDKMKTNLRCISYLQNSGF